MAMMKSDDEITGPINLGNPNEFTISALADMVISKTGTTSSIEHLPLPQDDPVRRQPDISRAEALLNWAPTVPLDDGLDRTIAYFRQTVIS
jgi:UDP-glucuronate decarboxylase